MRIGTRARRHRPGDRRHRASRTRPAARADVLAGGRRAVHYAAARLHRTSRRQGAQPRDVPPAGPRFADDRHALADREGRRLPLPRCRVPAAATARDGLPWRTAGTHPRGCRAAARERARADAGIADRRRTAAAYRRSSPTPPSARGVGGVRADGRGAAGRTPARRARSATTTATTRCGTTIPCSACSRWRGGGTLFSRPPLSASLGRRTFSSAICCRSSCRRCSRW